MPEKAVFRLPLRGRRKTNFQACKFSITCRKSENTRSLSPKFTLPYIAIVADWGGVSESPYKKVGPVSVLGRTR